MASTPNFRRLSLEDFKDAPEWLGRLVEWLNQVVEYIVLANNKGITFGENIQCEAFRVVEVLAGASAAACTAQFATTLKVKPQGVIPVRVVQKGAAYTVIGAAVTIEWRFDSGKILITSVTGLTNGTTYELTLLVI